MALKRENTQEAQKIRDAGGLSNPKLLNLINSPGEKMLRMKETGSIIVK